MIFFLPSEFPVFPDVCLSTLNQSSIFKIIRKINLTIISVIAIWIQPIRRWCKRHCTFFECCSRRRRRRHTISNHKGGCFFRFCLFHIKSIKNATLFIFELIDQFDHDNGWSIPILVFVFESICKSLLVFLYFDWKVKSIQLSYKIV